MVLAYVLIEGWIVYPDVYCLFSREEVPRKHKISFKRWLIKVRTNQQSYAEPLVREAIIRLVRRQAADLVCFLGTNTDIEKIISKLETAYGTVLQWICCTDATILWSTY